MGGGAFGVEAAAQFYFGKSVREVSMAEAALMAGLFKAPTKYAPHVNLPASRARTNEVLDNMVEAGFYTAGQVHAARLNPARWVETRRTDSPDWFLDWAFEEIQRVMEGRNAYVLTARTTIDLTMQKQAETALTSTIRQNGKSSNVRSGAMVVMEPDGAVRAIVGGMDYGDSQFNRATQARRQPGSSFKLYVYAAAMENGYNPHSTVSDSSRSCGNWHPQNYSGGHGGGARMPLWMAFAKSLNTTAAELSFVVGREKVIEMTQRLGVKGVRKTCSMALGDTGISPLEHTAAYAHFAHGGKSARPYAILEALTSKGDLVYARERDEPPPTQVVSRKVAEQMNQIMQKVVTEGTGKKATLDFTNSAGKTGTSSSYRDAWFMGFTGALVGGVWLGNDDFRPMSNVTGGSLPAQAWYTFMAAAHGTAPIPVIPGLAPHPNQINNPVPTAPEVVAGQQQGATVGTVRKSSLMTEQSRNALRGIAETLRKVGGLPEPAPPASAPGRPAPSSAPPERRAEPALPPAAPREATAAAASFPPPRRQ
jgi:penicillin-binding protein 1A